MQQIIFQGDRASVTVPRRWSPRPWQAEGPVMSAYIFHGKYRIEFMADKGSTTGYVYWKQHIDGGTVEKLDS